MEPRLKVRCHGKHFLASMGYDFGCMTASDTLFDSWGWVFGVELSYECITEIEVLMDVAMATIFWLSIHGVHISATWRMTELSMCGGDAALCQISLTTCCYCGSTFRRLHNYRLHHVHLSLYCLSPASP